MRYVDLNGAQPESQWLAKAAALTAQLEAAPNKDERDKIIESNAAVWGELKDWLRQVSHGKCWFSESRDNYSHWDVEHYRPKGKAKELDGTEQDGYWWLAFDWRNFRLCGNVGNRKKGAFFPLRQGSRRATAADRNTEDEIPYLLDPLRPDDPILLTFDESGDILPLPDASDWDRSRAEESIKRYKLRDHEPLVEARRDVWSKCAREINKCQNLMVEQDAAPSATKREQITQQMLRLRDMIKGDAEFSAVASECLRSRGHGWAIRLLANV